MRNNIDLIREISSMNVDILFLQETFVVDSDLGLFDYIDERYYSIAVGAVYSDKAIESGTGRPMGGLGVIWKKDCNFNVEVLSSERDYLVLRLKFNSFDIIIVNTYIRSDLGDPTSLANYLLNLNKLEQVLSDYNSENIFFIGDFNSDPFLSRSWPYLCDFIDNNELRCFDFEMLDNETYTHVNYGNSLCKWLDHVIGRCSDNVNVLDVKVLYDIVGSDHVPLLVTFKLCRDEINPLPLINDFCNDSYVDWENIPVVQIKDISKIAAQHQGSICNSEVYFCDVLGCRNKLCTQNIDLLYDKIVDSIKVSVVEFKKNKIRKNKYNVIPGWNRRVKQFHKTCRLNFKTWFSVGKPRNGQIYDNMINSRKIFKKELKNCKKQRVDEISKSIELSFRNKDMKSFWKDIKSKRNIISNPHVIDGVSDTEGIVKLFTNKFLPQIDTVDNSDNIWGTDVLNKVKNDKVFNLCLSTDTLIKLINELNSGCGHDLCHSKLLKGADISFLDNISSFINICYKHCYFPYKLLMGTISPIIKNNKKSKSCSSNYRPIMVSSCILKVIESHVLSVLKSKINLNCLQFGYMPGMSTSNACTLLKETVYYNLTKKSNIYSYFIDLSKAFDNVNHFKLLDKLLQYGVDADIVLLVGSYLRNQVACIKWNDVIGNYRVVNSGVRQGGILSPFLFNLYVDNLIANISNIGYGCKFGLSRVNIIAYADDMVLLSNSKD